MVAWPNDRVKESPELQARAMPLLWQFTAVYGVFVWLALVGIVFAVRNTASPIRFVSGLNLGWVLLAFYLAIIGVVAGIVFTVISIRRREWVPPLCSLAVNVLALACALWYGWESLLLFGE